MRWINKIVLMCVCWLYLGGCQDTDDGIPVRYYEFFNDELVIDSESLDIEMGISNVEMLGFNWGVVNATITDGVCVDSVIDNKNFAKQDFVSALEWEWFRVQKADGGKSLKVHVDANDGEERKLVVCIGSFIDYGYFTLIQKKIK